MLQVKDIAGSALACVALYQGMGGTLWVPCRKKQQRVGFSLDFSSQWQQGLKPSYFRHFAARLKPCPDTSRMHAQTDQMVFRYSSRAAF